MLRERLGHYRILARLGEGGMGEVYRAHDEHLDRDVALKLLHGSTVPDDTARARLLREARAAAALNHPAICTIHEVGEADGQPYIAMEWIAGRTLAESVSGGPLPAADVMRYGRDIADALAHAHSRQIIHRDLKTANVALTSDGRVKVLDFGLAKRLSTEAFADAVTEASPRTLTTAGAIVGTIAYMAPEQLRGQPADARSDVWALGVVLYELVTGKRPFRGQSAFEISGAIFHDEALPLPTTVPVPLRMVIARCLDKQPDRRYQTASEVRAALDAAASGTGAWTRQRYQRALRGPLVMTILLAAALAVGVLIRLSPLTTTSASVESIAVLPLENLSGDPAHDLLADGITEVVSTDLARLGGLRRVTARGSVVRYKGTTKPVEQIARELNVDAVVTGAVLRSGNRVSITVHLLQPSTGHQLWSNRYDRDLTDVLVVSTEIVAGIVREIRAQVSTDERARLASARPVRPEAFEAYLQGRFHWAKQTRQDYDLAERYFQSASERDPQFALAYAGLGSVWMMRADVGLESAAEAVPKADAYFAKALQLDDQLADIHVLIGNHKLTEEYNWRDAEREFVTAIRLNPNLADAHFFYSDMLLATKRPADWDREIHRALELDPLNEFNQTYYGWHLNYQQRYDEAIPIFQRLLPTGPNKAANYLGLWGAYYRKAMYADAIVAAKGYFENAGEAEFARQLGSADDVATYRAAMQRTAEAMIAASAHRRVPALRIARMFAHADMKDEAFRWLEKAYADREPPLLRLGVVWDWFDLHGDPRFVDLLRRLKLPE